MSLDADDLLTVPALLESMRGAEPHELDRAALTFYRGRTRTGSRTRRELLDDVDRVTAALSSTWNITRGDRVAILSPNALVVPALVLALLRLGAPIVPLNPTASPDDWAYVLRHAGARKLFASAEILETWRRSSACRTFEASLATCIAELVDGPAGGPTNGVPPAPPGQEPSANDLAIILYTSGTTGNPKGVGLSHRNILANARSMARNFELRGATQLAVLPLYHAHAFGFGLMTSLLSDGHLVFVEKLDPFNWAEVIRREEVTVTSVVPNLLPALIQVRVHRDKVPSLRAVLVSSAPLAPSVARAFEEQTGLPLIHGWGLSEYTNFACCLSPAAPAEDHQQMLFGWDSPSIGPALSGVEVVVRDPSGKDLAEGERGELWVRGPSCMLGYFRDPEATEAAIRDGWLRTGDEGYFRWHGGHRIYFITSRIKEIIIRGAEKYSPLAIEQALVQAVPEVDGKLVVVGFPHDVHGEEVGAYLEATTLPDELRARLTQALGAMPVETRPKVLLHGSDPIPRTHTGKVQRRKLTHLFAPFPSCRGPAAIVEVTQPPG